MSDLVVKKLLARQDIQSRFSAVLGQKSNSFISSVISAVSANSALQSADPMSVIGAAMVAATLDLPINQSLGFAHIVPYNGRAQFQMGWKGFVQLAMRSGQYKTINVAIVHEGDIIKHNRFTGDIVFADEYHADAPKVGYVAYFRLVNGFEKFYYMTVDEVRSHAKRYSQSYNRGSGRWHEDFDAMAMKTVVKLMLSKYGILSVEMQKAIETDQAVMRDDGEPVYVDSPGSDSEGGEKNDTAVADGQIDMLDISAAMAVSAKKGGKK